MVGRPAASGVRASGQVVARLFAVLVGVAGCGAAEQEEKERSVGYEVLDADARPLRDVFNADSGSVRVLMLASPT